MKTSNVLYQLLESLTAGNTLSPTRTTYDRDNNIITIHSDEKRTQVLSSTFTNSPTKTISKAVKEHKRTTRLEQKSVSSNVNSDKQPLYFNQAIKTLDMIKAAIIIFNINKNGLIETEFTSPNFAKFIKTSSTVLESNPDVWLRNIHAYDFTQIVAPALEQVVSNNEAQQIEYRYLSDEGLIWIQSNLIPEIDNEVGTIQIFCFLQDVTDQVTIQSKSHNQHELAKTIAQNGSLIVYTYDFFNDKYEFLENGFEKMTRSPDQTVPKSHEDFLEIIHPDDKIRFKEYRTNLIQKKDTAVVAGQPIEIRILKSPDNWSQTRIVEAMTLQQPFNTPLIQGIIEDRSEVDTIQQQLSERTQFDHLTQLPNRMMFIQHASEKLSELNHSNLKSLALMFININRFNVINDSLGYANGDKLLAALGARLKQVSDENTFLSRLGVDEFALLIENFGDEEELRALSKRLIANLSLPFEIDDLKIHTSVSIGVCVADPGNTRVEVLISNAGVAVQNAKKYPSGGFAIFSDGMHESTYSRFVLEGELHNAIINEELELHYQPQYSLTQDSITGCESLVRWRNKTRGLIMPDNFIPIAEESGLIIELDTWVINHACRTLKKWNRKGITCTMSVNISSRFFNENDPVAMISKALEDSGADPTQLELEITEGAIMRDLESSKKLLKELQNLGIKIAIDDFGTGYSSLAYLKELTINTLKIDKKFISDLLSDSNSQAIVRSIINLAKLLDMNIVAEGCETLDQVMYLRSHDCDMIQGFLLSKPLDERKLLQFFNNTSFSLNTQLV